MPERHCSGFIPLTLVACFIGYNLNITIPEPEPVTSCLMKHKPMGRDENGRTIMKHWRPCESESQSQTDQPGLRSDQP